MPTTELDEQSRPPSPTRNPFGLGFRPAVTPDDLPSSQLPSPTPSPELDDPSPADLALDSVDDWDEASVSPESPAGTSSPGSTPAPEVLDDDALRDMARVGVAMAGHQAHEHLTRTPAQKDVGLYLTDEEDQAGIGDPLARIAARHQGVGKVSPDTKDALAAMVALARYATKQATLGREAKARDLAGRGPQPMPEAVDL